MKKCYFLMMAMLVSLCASAVDFQLVGGFNGWKEMDPTTKFTDNGDGTYVLDYNGTLTSGFKVKSCETGWVDAYNWGSNGSKLVIGKVYTLSDPAGNSSNIEIDNEIVNPHVVFNPTAKSLLITGQEQEAKFKYGIHGDIFGVSSWSTENMTESDGKWVLANKTVVAGNFGIKQMSASTSSQTAWINADGSATVVVGTAMPCKVDGTNFSIAAGTYTFTFDPEAMTLTVTGEGTVDPTPDPTPGYTGWYLNVQGDFNNWQPKGVEFGKDGVTTAKNLAIGTNEFEIKVWNGTADEYYVADAPVVIGQPTVLKVIGGAHMTINGAAEGDAFDVTFDYATKAMTVTRVGEVPTPEITPLYLVGATMGWGTTDKNKMIGDAAGNYTIHVDKLVGEFKITTDIVDGNWNDDLTFSAQKELTIGEATECISGGGLGNMTIGLGVTNATVEFNIDTKMIKVTGTPITEVVTKYFIKGNFYDTNWPSVEMLKGEDGLYSATIIPMDNENCEFIVYQTNDGVEAAWYKGCVAEVGKTVTMSTDGTNATVVLEDRNTYKFSFNPETLALTVDKTSGVADIEAAEEVPAVYYNLQGVRVANPENGLFLEVRGNVVRKVVK